MQRTFNNIYEAEKSLLNYLRDTYPKNIKEAFVEDGLCWSSISNAMPDKSNRNYPECLWVDSERRVLFLLKEPNGNGGHDYKEWDWSCSNETFGNMLAYWLEGLMITTSDYCPSYNELSSRSSILKKYPLALVNLKKIAGDSEADWKEVREHAERDEKYISRQIREILKPNIIVCGGSTTVRQNKVISIALDTIFSDIKNGFKQINSWVYYNADANLVLIDAYHPSYRYGGSEEYRTNELLMAFNDFVRQTNYKN